MAITGPSPGRMESLALALILLLATPAAGQVTVSGASEAEYQIKMSGDPLPAGIRYPSVNKFGFNGAIAAVEEVVWTGSTTFNWPPSAVTMTIVSARRGTATSGRTSSNDTSRASFSAASAQGSSC